MAGDLSNGGHNSTAKAVTEAATVIGWKVSVYDGQGNAQGNSDAMNQAITSQPAAIILGGLDPTEQAPAIKQATDAGIPVIGWHAGVLTGPGNGMVTNVSTDPLKVSQLAAAYAVADSDGNAGVAIFTDGQYELAVTKARALEAYVKACTGCSVLSFEDSPIATADQRMPGLVSNLLQQNGDKLTYLLAINGNYFGGAARALEDAGKPKDGPPKSVAAGDGDAAEMQRIRSSNYQAATVAEPITLQGWQLVDEVNRKLAGEAPVGLRGRAGPDHEAERPERRRLRPVERVPRRLQAGLGQVAALLLKGPVLPTTGPFVVPAPRRALVDPGALRGVADRSGDQAPVAEVLEDAQEHRLGLHVLVEAGAARLGAVGEDVVVPREDDIAEGPRGHRGVGRRLQAVPLDHPVPDRLLVRHHLASSSAAAARRRARTSAAIFGHISSTGTGRRWRC